MAAIAIPLVPEKVESWKAFAREITGPRGDEFTDFNERMGLTAHRVWLMQSPQGPLAIVVHDGPGADTFPEQLAKSDYPFDRYFLAQISEAHGADLSQPLPGPPPEVVIDWRAG